MLTESLKLGDSPLVWQQKFGGVDGKRKEKEKAGKKRVFFFNPWKYGKGRGGVYIVCIVNIFSLL